MLNQVNLCNPILQVSFGGFTSCAANNALDSVTTNLLEEILPRGCVVHVNKTDRHGRVQYGQEEHEIEGRLKNMRMWLLQGIKQKLNTLETRGRKEIQEGKRDKDNAKTGDRRTKEGENILEVIQIPNIWDVAQTARGKRGLRTADTPPVKIEDKKERGANVSRAAVVLSFQS